MSETDNTTDQGLVMASGFGDQNFNEAFDLGQSGTIADGYKELAGYEYTDGADFTMRTVVDMIKPIYDTDRIAQKIITVPVADALANWREVDNPEVATLEDNVYAGLAFSEAIIKARLYGCAVILPILRRPDGGLIAASRTLDNVIASEPNIVVDKLLVACKEVRFHGALETNIYAPNYGLPKKMDIGTVKVHPSRCIIVGGLDSSFFGSIRADLIEYHESRRRLQTAAKKNGALILETDVDKIAQMLKKIERTTGEALSVKEVTNRRARTLFANFNETDVGVLNAGEKAHFYQAQNLSDLVNVVELNKRNLSGVSDIVFSRLFGKPSGTLGGSSDVDFENYSQSLDSLRVSDAEPALRTYDEIIAKVLGIENGFSYDWNDTRVEELRLSLRGDTGQTTTDPAPNTEDNS